MNTKNPYHFIGDLKVETADPLQEAKPEENIQGRAIYADSSMKVLLFPFAPGQELKEHRTPHAAILQIVKGRGEISLGEDRNQVWEGSWVRMEGLCHGIRAETEVILLLQVFLTP